MDKIAMVGEEVVKHSNDIKAFPEGAGENVSLKPNGDFEPSPHRKTVNDRGTSCLTVKHKAGTYSQ